MPLLYPYRNPNVKSLMVADAKFKGEQPMSLLINNDMLIAKVFLYAKTPLDLWRLREKAVDAVKVAFDDSDTIAWAQICTNAVKFDSNVPSYKCCISIEFEKD